MEEKKNTTRRFRRRLLLGALAGILLAGGGAVVAYLLWPPYHFDVVDPGILYRSGQNGKRGLEKIYAEANIRTIVDLCMEKRQTRPALEEQAFVREKGIHYIHLPVPPGMKGADDHIRRFLEIMDDQKNHPVLVHCWKGVKRTGVMVSIYKMEYHKIGLDQALEELPTYGRVLEDFQVSEVDCVKNYVPRWKRKDSLKEEESAKVPDSSISENP